MKITVEVAYALPQVQRLIQVGLDSPATVGEAISASGIVAEFPDIDLARNRVGVFGRRASLETPLRDGDRVEIYRPLTADPKESRRRRAEHARRLKR